MREITMDDVEERLTRIGEEARQRGAAILQCIEHPGPDPRITEAAAGVVKDLYHEGEFGPWYRSPFWLGEKADDLAGCLQACAEDWERENANAVKS